MEKQDKTYQDANAAAFGFSRVKLIGGVREESYGKLLTFEDLDGHWLEFFENKRA